MEDRPTVSSPLQVVIDRMRELRTKRRMTAQQLAEAMTRAGVQWEAGVVTKLETGRRKSLSVTEMLALAYVLDVAPVHLLVPPDAYDVPYPLAEGVEVSAHDVRGWIRGQAALPGTDRRLYFSEVPDREFSPRVLFERTDGVVERVLSYEKSSEAFRMDESPNWRRVPNHLWHVHGGGEVVVQDEPGKENGEP